MALYWGKNTHQNILADQIQDNRIQGVVPDVVSIIQDLSKSFEGGFCSFNRSKSQQLEVKDGDTISSQARLVVQV